MTVADDGLQVVWNLIPTRLGHCRSKLRATADLTAKQVDAYIPAEFISLGSE